jgi:hypothetical protein
VAVKVIISPALALVVPKAVCENTTDHAAHHGAGRSGDNKTVPRARIVQSGQLDPLAPVTRKPAVGSIRLRVSFWAYGLMSFDHERSR